MAEKLGVMVCGHGSRNNKAVAQFAQVAHGLKEKFPELPVEYGYLEFASPVIRTGLDKLKACGCTKILAVPGMLFAAGHAKNDIPSVLRTYEAQNKDIEISYGKELGIDPKMLQASGDRIRQSLDQAGSHLGPHDTLLMVVGRGASDPDANANIAKVMRLLWEGFGFGWGETAYSGVTFPLVEPGLRHAAKLGYKRIVVFPYFLFTGVLVNRIYLSTDTVAAEFPDIEFLKVPYLNNHPLVIETFKERVEQILQGDNLMNCQMCKYRTQVLGFEDQAGEPQHSHHHHVEGVSTGCELCDDECTGACQSLDLKQKTDEYGHSHPDSPAHNHSHNRLSSHDSNNDRETHHHHPYPHADHPLGPITLDGSARLNSWDIGQITSETTSTFKPADRDHPKFKK